MSAQPLDPASAPRRSPAVVLALLAAALAALAALRLGVGEDLGWPRGKDAGFIVKWRMHRLVLAAAAGGALACAGVALQALIRNPLGEPFVFGLSSGAAVGIMVQGLIGYAVGRDLGGGHVGALLGAGLSMLIVYLVGRRRGTLDPIGLVLVGIALATIHGAIIHAINYAVARHGLSLDINQWMLGTLNEGLGWRITLGTAAAIVAGIGVVGAQARAMDAATFSEGEAISLGVDVPRLRKVLFAASCVLAAGAVVLAGPIAFVGLICPHLGRLLLGPRHAALVPVAVLLGALLLVLADMAGVLMDKVPYMGRMPIGFFTAIIGGPLFVAMLRPHLGRGVE